MQDRGILLLVDSGFLFIYDGSTFAYKITFKSVPGTKPGPKTTTVMFFVHETSGFWTGFELRLFII